MVKKKKDLCILHIGMPKTGSSTIQDNLYKHLEDERVEYINFGTSNHSAHMYSLFMEEKKFANYHFFKNRHMSRSDILNFRKSTKMKLEKSFLNFKKTINIFSAEDLFHASETEIRDMKEYLNQYFSKIIIVSYVRPAKSFCASAFQQRVKFHNLNEIKHNRIYHKYMNIKRYINIYGEDNVKILPFVPKKFYKNDLLKDFCNHCQIEEQESVIKKANETLSKEAISVLFTYNLHENIHVDYKINNIIIHTQLIDKFKNFGKEKFKFSGKLIQSWIDQFYKEDYNWLLSKIDEKYKEDFLLDPNEDGISHKNELLEYSVTQIEALVELIKDKKSINFPLEEHPRTVAKLVNIIRNGGKKD